MSYKKPQILARSAARQSFVAGCPEKGISGRGCMNAPGGTGALNIKCNSGIPK